MSATKQSDEFQIITEDIKKELELIRHMDGLEKKYKNEDIKEMINYVVAATDKMEDRRAKISDATWQLFAIILAAFGLLISTNFINTIFLWRFPVIAILVIVLLSTILKLIEFEAQSGFRYPFLSLTEYGNRWKWFYYGIEDITKIKRNPFFPSKKRIKSDQLSYMKGLNFFLGKYHNESIDDELVDNLLHLYLLKVHNYYKNRFYLRLLGYNKYTLWVIIGFLILYWVFVGAGVVFSPEIRLFLMPK